MLNVKSPPYNAVGDGVALDHDAIQRALNDAGAVEEVYLPAGTFLVDKPLNTSGRKLRGELFWRPGQGGTTIKAASNFVGSAVVSAASNPSQLLDLHIDASGATDYALHVYKCNGGTTVFANISVSRAKRYGAYIQECQSATVERITAKANVVGIYAVDCNATRLSHCLSNENTSHGMVVERVNASAGCRVHNLISERNGGHGLLVQKAQGVLIENGWLEANKQDGIQLVSCRNVIVEGTRISGGDAPDDRCVRLIDCAMCRVYDCSAAYNGHIDYLRITDRNGTTNELHEHNWRISDVVVQRLPVEPKPD